MHKKTQLPTITKHPSVHPELRGPGLNKETVIGFLVIFAILLGVSLPWFSLGIAPFLCSSVLITVAAARLFLPLLLIEWGTRIWKARVTRAFYESECSIEEVTLSQVSSDVIGDPIYPQDQPWRSFPSLRILASIDKADAESETIDLFSLKTNELSTAYSEKVKSRTYRDKRNGKIICIEIGGCLMWRSRYGVRRRRLISWDLPMEWLMIGGYSAPQVITCLKHEFDALV